MPEGSHNGTSPVLTELRLVYAVPMPSGRLRHYLRPTYAYRRAARLALGEKASDTDVAAFAQRLMQKDADPRKQTQGVTDDTNAAAATPDREPD